MSKYLHGLKKLLNVSGTKQNIPLDIIDNNKHEDGGINFYISYIGPLGGKGNNKSVKVDISRSETLEFEPVLEPAFIDYSDLEDYDILCYPLEEVLIEKLRLVMQRKLIPLVKEIRNKHCYNSQKFPNTYYC